MNKEPESEEKEEDEGGPWPDPFTIQNYGSLYGATGDFLAATAASILDKHFTQKGGLRSENTQAHDSGDGSENDNGSSTHKVHGEFFNTGQRNNAHLHQGNKSSDQCDISTQYQHITRGSHTALNKEWEMDKAGEWGKIGPSTNT